MKLPPRSVRALATVLLAVAVCSCTSTKTYFLDEPELTRFLAAGPVAPELDQDALLAALPTPGPYRTVTGDVLEIHAPDSFYGELVGEQPTYTTRPRLLARVDAEGKIQVPLAGEILAGGRTLTEIERDITEAVYPRYLKARPPVVVRVEEHQRISVSVIGAVLQPGIHQLRSDQQSLFAALGLAGGIIRSSNLVVGARRIRISRPGESGQPESIMLPVEGLDLPVSDVRLVGGERIEVERYEPQTFTVVGLVNLPGSYDYPTITRYNLMQALAVAGGVDTVARPPYVTIFRKDTDGTILPATFGIDGHGVVESSGLSIKPGDVIVVQQTAATWTRSLIAEVFRLQVNVFTDPLQSD